MNDIKVENASWGTAETFAENNFFAARYVFMEADREMSIESAAADLVTFYVLGGAMVVTYFELETNVNSAAVAQTVSLCCGTNFEVPANTQYYMRTGTEMSAEFIEVRRGTVS